MATWLQGFWDIHLATNNQKFHDAILKNLDFLATNNPKFHDQILKNLDFFMCYTSLAQCKPLIVKLIVVVNYIVLCQKYICYYLRYDFVGYLSFSCLSLFHVLTFLLYIFQLDTYNLDGS